MAANPILARDGGNGVGFQALPAGADNPSTLAAAKTGASLATGKVTLIISGTTPDGGV